MKDNVYSVSYKEKYELLYFNIKRVQSTEFAITPPSVSYGFINY